MLSRLWWALDGRDKVHDEQLSCFPRPALMLPWIGPAPIKMVCNVLHHRRLCAYQEYVKSSSQPVQRLFVTSAEDDTRAASGN